MSNPTPGQATLLQQIAQRESNGNYAATVLPQNCPNPPCTASGAYQITDGTWAMATANTGVPFYPTAASAPPAVQDANALWLLQRYGPNATQTWAASGPYDENLLASSIPGATQPLVDLSGAASSTSSADILTSLESAVGLDPTSPVSDVVVALAAAAVVWLAAG